jgi:hypothetical protein
MRPVRAHNRPPYCGDVRPRSTIAAEQVSATKLVLLQLQVFSLMFDDSVITKVHVRSGVMWCDADRGKQRGRGRRAGSWGHFRRQVFGPGE